jgi:hypothetical protein
VVDILKQHGIEVDVFRYDLDPNEGDLVDKRLWRPRLHPLPRDYYEANKTLDVDVEAAALCSKVQCLYRPGYSEQTTRNAVRQLYSESRVGHFLNQNQDQYDVAIVIGSDIYVPWDISMQDINRALTCSTKAAAGAVECSTPREILITGNNDAGGVTNGFYVGAPAVVSAVMSRLYDPDNFPEQEDYERQLKRSFERHSVVTRKLINFDRKFQSFCKLRYSGEYWPTYPYLWRWRTSLMLSMTARHLIATTPAPWVELDEETRACMAGR